MSVTPTSYPESISDFASSSSSVMPKGFKPLIFNEKMVPALYPVSSSWTVWPNNLSMAFYPIIIMKVSSLPKAFPRMQAFRVI
jgi:hypothetical protein